MNVIHNSRYIRSIQKMYDRKMLALNMKRGFLNNNESAPDDFIKASAIPSSYLIMIHGA